MLTEEQHVVFAPTVLVGQFNVTEQQSDREKRPLQFPTRLQTSVNGDMIK